MTPKTVLITGASSGIGRASARYFAAHGWNVVATMRSPANERELTELPNILVTRLDVQDRDSISRALAVATERFGKIDVLVNNAGYGQYGVFESIPREKVQAQFDVNLFGTMDVTRGLLPHFRGNKGGIIINVGSGAGIFTLPMLSLYCASKFALEGFSEALSYELASQNIVVKLIQPYGGVAETHFSETAAAKTGGEGGVTDYDDFVRQTNDALARMAAARTISSSDVAVLIFQAATDGSDRLRYLIGDDSRGFLKARKELPEQEYIDFMRSKFLPPR